MSTRKIMIDITKWQPLLDASRKYQYESQEENILK